MTWSKLLMRLLEAQPCLYLFWLWESVMLTFHPWINSMPMTNHFTLKSIRNTWQVILSSLFHSHNSSMIPNCWPKKCWKKFLHNSWAIWRDMVLSHLKFMMLTKEKSKQLSIHKNQWRVRVSNKMKYQNFSQSWKRNLSMSAQRWAVTIPMSKTSLKTRAFLFMTTTYLQIAWKIKAIKTSCSRNLYRIQIKAKTLVTLTLIKVAKISSQLLQWENLSVEEWILNSLIISSLMLSLHLMIAWWKKESFARYAWPKTLTQSWFLAVIGAFAMIAARTLRRGTASSADWRSIKW